MLVITALMNSPTRTPSTSSDITTFLATVHHCAMPFTCSASSFTVGFFILRENQALLVSVAVLPTGNAVLYYLLESLMFLRPHIVPQRERLWLCLIDIELFLRPQRVPHREENSRKMDNMYWRHWLSWKPGCNPLNHTRVTYKAQASGKYNSFASRYLTTTKSQEHPCG
jgi:hypothetical protein